MSLGENLSQVDRGKESKGVGIQFNMAEDTLLVIQPVSGGPSEKAGILAGDRIVYKY